MGAWRRIRSRGVLYTIGGKFNQVVPTWLFRFRIFRIYRLHPLPSDVGTLQSTPTEPSVDRRATESQATSPYGGADAADQPEESNLPSTAGADVPSPLQFRWCQSQKEIETAKQLTFFHNESEDSAERFRACLAVRGDELLGGVWQARNYFDEDELGVRIVFTDDQAWIFAAFVAKSVRGQRIYPRLLNHVLNDYRQLHHLASINTTNRASIAAHRHFVSQQTGPCIVIRILGITICWAGRSILVRPFYSTNGQQRPVKITVDL